MDPRRRHLHHYRPPSPSFLSSSIMTTSRRYNNAPPPPPLAPRFIDPYYFHRSHPIAHPFSSPRPHHRPDQHQNNLCLSSSPDHARRKYLLEAAEMEDRRRVERLLYDSSVKEEERDRLHFINHSQIVPNPRVSNRIAFPGGLQDGAASMAPHRGGMMVRGNPGDLAIVGDHVDDGSFRVRVPPSDLQRGLPGRYEEGMESRHVILESGGDVIGRKRTRREEEVVYSDAVFLEESHDLRGRRKAGFWGGRRGGSRHQDMPFEREPSEASSHGHAPFQTQHPAGFVFGRNQHPVDDSRDSEKSRFLFNVESSHDLPGDHQSAGKGKRVLFGNENTQEVGGGRKPSVLSRIQHSQPVWNRLEEQRHVPLSSSVHSDTAVQSNPPELKVGYKSNVLVPKVILPSSLSGDLQNTDGRNGKERNPKIKLAIGEDINRKASIATTAAATETVESHKSTMKEIPVYVRPQANKKSEGRVIKLNRSKKTLIVGTSDSSNATLKSNEKALVSGISIGISKDQRKNKLKESFDKIKMKEGSVSCIPNPVKKVTTVASPKLEVQKGACDAHALSCSDGEKHSLVTSKEKVVSKPTDLHCHVVKSSDGNATVEGVCTDLNTSSSIDPPTDSTFENVFSPVSAAMVKSGENAKNINDSVLANNGKTTETDFLEYERTNNSLVSHKVDLTNSDGNICDLETFKKVQTENTLDAPGATLAPKDMKEVSSWKVLTSPSTCISDTQTEVTPVHHLKEEVWKDTLFSPDTHQLKFGQTIEPVNIDREEVQEELREKGMIDCNRENASDRNSNEKASQERVSLPCSAVSRKNTREVKAELEEPVVTTMTTPVSPINKVTTAESLLIRETDEVLAPITSAPILNLSFSNNKVKENLFSLGSPTISNENVGSSTKTQRNRKQKSKEKTSNPMVLSSLGSTHELCKTLGSSDLTKDLTSTFSKEAQVLPTKKKRRKKRKYCNPPVPPLPSLNQTKENCIIISYMSDDKFSLSSGKSCKKPNQLEKVIPSSDPKCLENAQNLLALSSPCEDLDESKLSGKTSLRFVSNNISMEKNIAELTMEENLFCPKVIVSIDNNLFCPTIEDVRNCISPKHCSKENLIFHQDDVRDGKSHSGGFLPGPGDSEQLAGGVALAKSFHDGGAATNMVGSSSIKAGEDMENLAVNNLVEKPVHVHDISSREREIEQDILVPSNSCTKPEVPIVDMGSIITNANMEIVHAGEEGKKNQQVPILLTSETQVSVDDVPVTVESKCNHLNLLLQGGSTLSNSSELEKAGLLCSSTSDCNSTLTKHSLGTQVPQLDSQKPDENVPEVMYPVQIYQQNDIFCGNNLTNGEDSYKGSLKSPIKRSASEPQLGLELDKTSNNDRLFHEGKMSQLLPERKIHFNCSNILAKRTSTVVKDCNNYLLPPVLPHRASFAAKPQANLTSSQNGRHRTWCRTNSSCASSQSTRQQFQLKHANLSSFQRHLPRKIGKQQGSYVRKGNSLIRKSSTAAPLQQSNDLGAIFQADRNVTSNSTTSVNKIENVNDMTCSTFGGISPNIERPRTPPVAPSSKQMSCTSDPLTFIHPGLLYPSQEVDSEVQTLSAKSRNFGLGSPEHHSFPSTEENKKYTSKPMVYVKHRSNQLVATTEIETGNLSSHLTERDCAVSSSLSDAYFTRKKSQLVRDTTLLNRHLKQVDLTDNSKPESQNISKTSILEEKHRVPCKRKSGKVRKFSAVWRLDNGLNTPGKVIHTINNILPCIFPWKRAMYWRPSANNISRTRTIALISKKLQLSRKRDTLYTVSKGGFSLRKSGVLSIGRSNLTWSKSIERRSKKVNEQATRAVAEVERKKRELKEPCHLNGGKSDHHLSSLLSSPTNQQSENGIPNSFNPRRLLIGHDEYIRIGNGNKLVRDPKKLVRMLASEKIRWSLHTARKRLARKQEYCQFFTRFGKCNKEAGKCPYIHDPGKVAICTKFLKGICFGTNCRLTHKVIPERMPDCSYFLQGLCTNIGCPYRHVNVHPKSSICEGFLKGYCADGDECRKKHSYVCPDFEATGKCLEGSSCKLHHPKQQNKSRKRKSNTEQVPRKGRYFVSSITEVCQQCDSRLNIRERSGDSFLSEGHFAEYIRLDPDSEDDGKNGPMYSRPLKEVAYESPDKWLDDLSSLTKPIRIMSL